jgi:hypothetical protein
MYIKNIYVGSQFTQTRYSWFVQLSICGCVLACTAHLHTVYGGGCVVVLHTVVLSMYSSPIAEQLETIACMQDHNIRALPLFTFYSVAGRHSTAL